MSRYGFGSNVHTLGGSSRRSSVARSTITFDDIQSLIISGSTVSITIDNPNMTHQIKGNTLLHEAIQAQNIHFVNYLIDNGADVNTTDSSGWTPLHFACQYGDMKIV